MEMVMSVSDLNGSFGNLNNSLSNIVAQQFQGNITDWGYCRLPNGLIFQWGNLSGMGFHSDLEISGGGVGTNNFPISFPNKCFTIIAGNNAQQGAYADNAYAYPLNNSQFWIQTFWSGGASGYGASFFAIGH